MGVFDSLSGSGAPGRGQCSAGLARMVEMLADHGAARLNGILDDACARLAGAFGQLRRAAAAGDAERCARLLLALRMDAEDAGLGSLGLALRGCERRARAGAVPSLPEAAALTAGFRAERAAALRMLRAAEAADQRRRTRTPGSTSLFG